MYQIEVGANERLKTSEKSDIPRVVFWVGMTSLLTDISSEMIASALPIFLYSVLNLSPLQVGFFDGLYLGCAAFVRVFAGFAADRFRNNYVVASTGYALGVLARLILVFSSFFFGGVVLLALLLDRIGKGIRTAPRDAIIAGHAPATKLAEAMGLHRRLDAIGAFIGPFVAAGLLWWWPMEFKFIFSLSLFFAALGLAVFWFRVNEPPRSLSTEIQTLETDANLAPKTLKFAAQPVLPLSISAALRLITANKAYIGLTVLTIALNTLTISDGLIYLSLQKKFGLEAHSIPLMFVATAFVFVLTALRVGRLADRFGAVRVFLAGYATLALAYVWFAFGMGKFTAFGEWSPIFELGLLIVLLGLHYAATDGILAVLAIQCLPAQVRTTGLAIIATALGITKIVSSSLYGWLWQEYDATVAAQIFAVASVACWCVVVCVLHVRKRSRL
jgi:MFS family permease